MLPKWHVLYGLIFSFLISIFFSFNFLEGTIIFLASVLIDLDHYFLYILKHKKLHPLSFWNHSMSRDRAWRKLSKVEKKKFKEEYFIFHGVEFLIILIILAINFNFFFLILLGIVFHLFLDYIDILLRKEHFAIKVSQIWLYQRNKNKKEFNFI